MSALWIASAGCSVWAGLTALLWAWISSSFGRSRRRVTWQGLWLVLRLLLVVVIELSGLRAASAVMPVWRSWGPRRSVSGKDRRSSQVGDVAGEACFPRPYTI